MSAEKSMMTKTHFPDTRTIMCESAMEFVGNTPLLYLRKIGRDLPAEIAVKIEYCNPACSVKDRAALRMIEDAEEKGLIKPGVTTLIEPTSGNMGIALAFTCAVKGYRLILTMPSTMSLERRALLKAYGAELVLTEPATAVLGALKRARELSNAIPNSYILNQFENSANTAVHYETTGPEIWRQTGGKVDICCFGVGSGGTVMGVGQYLREQKPSVKIYAVEPFESSVINGFPHAPHKIPGMGAGWVPPIVNKTGFEEALRVRSQEAIDMARRLAREEGILVGISSGANVCAAVDLAKRPENEGKLIVTSCASFGERYLSTDLYKEIKDECEHMGLTSLEEDIAYLKTKGFIIA